MDVIPKPKPYDAKNNPYIGPNLNIEIKVCI